MYLVVINADTGMPLIVSERKNEKLTQSYLEQHTKEEQRAQCKVLLNDDGQAIDAKNYEAVVKRYTKDYKG